MCSSEEIEERYVEYRPNCWNGRKLVSNHIGADQFKEEGKKGNAFRIESRAEREIERERAHGTAPR